ncbi:hypothetical protein [Pectinatus haikarae]|uniref:hypothetical protein n=1 Tax=Pectinatus haikarae TaxID=349096 RepID=UPI0018C6EB81|nr:hypothetical protein [Pectinatus haikarae]
MIDPSMLDSSFVENVSDMLQLAIMCCDRPPKALAIDVGCSLSAIYEAMKGTRTIPIKVRKKLSKLNFTAAATVALESTGFIRLFGYRKIDRHIQSMIVSLKVTDNIAYKDLEKLPVLLLNKNSRDDMADDDYAQVKIIAERLVDRTNSNINLIMELDTKYKLDLEKYLRGEKEKPQTRERLTAS